MTKLRLPAFLMLLPAFVAGCDGPQSWVNPAGEDAELVAGLLWVLMGGAALIWVAVIGMAVWAGRISPGPHSRRGSSAMILWGGIVTPTVVISALMVTGLIQLRAMTDRTAELTVAAQGEQWWWRIEHQGPDGQPVPTPNELRLPNGRTAEVLLTADKVIHSFWVPSLGGKMDMIPGRENRMTLSPTRTGTYRGVCAEYCGGAHAQMAFPAVIMEPDDFAAWLARQAEPAAEPATEAAREGRALFLANGCGACHAIRGTEAEGQVGPDLTHVASRTALGAGILPMEREAMIDWIARTKRVKPGVLMPAYGMLPDDEVALIADYLMGLD